MKLTRKNKKLINSVVVVTGSVLLIFFLLQLTSTPKTIYDGCFDSDISDNVLCMKQFDSTSFSNQLTIGLSDNNPLPNENLRITIGVVLPFSSDINTKVAKLELRNSDNVIIDNWDLTNQFNGGGTFTYSFNVRSPNEPGSYTLFFYGFSETGVKFVEPVKEFVVGSTSCPANTCTDFELLSTVDNGETFDKQCVEYTSEPVCDDIVTTEYKIKCDAGYLVTGKDSSVYVVNSFLKLSNLGCVSEKQDNIIKCYACDNNEIITIEQNKNCVSPLSSDKNSLNCGSGNTEITDNNQITICKGYEVVKGGECRINFNKAIMDTEFYKDNVVIVAGSIGTLLLLFAYFYTRSQNNRAVF